MAKTKNLRKRAKKAVTKGISSENSAELAKALGCCEKFLRKSKVCSNCPLMCHLTKKQRKKQIKKLCRAA